MNKSILVTLLYASFWCTQTFSQQKEHGSSKLGIALEANFSSLDYNGISPMITYGNDCHEFQLGTRLNFNKMYGGQARNPQLFVVDLGYRIVYFNRLRWLQLYSIFKTEYGNNRETQTWNYIVPEEEDLDALYLGSSSFKAHSDIKTHTINFNLGVGAEFELTNNLYFKTDACLGVGGNTVKRKYTNVETNENVLNSMMLYGNRQMSWMLSAGIGYRFGSNKSFRY